MLKPMIRTEMVLSNILVVGGIKEVQTLSEIEHPGVLSRMLWCLSVTCLLLHHADYPLKIVIISMMKM